jgi:hypothetical protein
MVSCAAHRLPISGQVGSEYRKEFEYLVRRAEKERTSEEIAHDELSSCNHGIVRHALGGKP